MSPVCLSGRPCVTRTMSSSFASKKLCHCCYARLDTSDTNGTNGTYFLVVPDAWTNDSFIIRSFPSFPFFLLGSAVSDFLHRGKLRLSALGRHNICQILYLLLPPNIETVASVSCNNSAKQEQDTVIESPPPSSSCTTRQYQPIIPEKLPPSSITFMQHGDVCILEIHKLSPKRHPCFSSSIPHGSMASHAKGGEPSLLFGDGTSEGRNS